VRVWDAVSGAPITTLKGHSQPVTSVAFSTNGLQLASGSEGCTVRLWDHWDAISSPPITTLGVHSSLVTSIAFSPNGLQLASGSTDGTVQLWDAMSGAPIVRLNNDFEPVMFIAFSLDGLQLVSRSLGGTVRGWDAISGVPIAIQEDSSLVKGTSFSPLGAIWSCKGRWIQALLPPRSHARRVLSLSPIYSPSTEIVVPNSPVPSQIAFGCYDGRIMILDVPGHYINS
jgi:WD40 repeat protein